MKKLFSFILTILSFLIAHQTVAQQPVSAKKITAVTSAEIQEQVTAIQKKAGVRGWDFLTKGKIETTAQKQMLEQCKKGKAIIDMVIKLGDMMTDAEAIRFDTQMRQVVVAIDAIYAASVGTQGGSQGGCFGSCDNQYHGWGHGYGWNRFWCKTSCFKIEIHLG